MGIFSTTVSNFLSHFFFKTSPIITITLFKRFWSENSKGNLFQSFFPNFCGCSRAICFYFVKWLRDCGNEDYLVCFVFPSLNEYGSVTMVLSVCDVMQIFVLFSRHGIMARKLKEKENTFYLCCKCDMVTWISVPSIQSSYSCPEWSAKLMTCVCVFEG